ncbi:hypothetical protein [Catenuloplanes japonicus]|uniref:hypothetical protein n=1 Tax=Catenuloplanes japonicus TaxID=33876 RepID=UPI000AFC6654|nr:hypothetical protein [Catenuloplanes japonicus]
MNAAEQQSIRLRDERRMQRLATMAEAQRQANERNAVQAARRAAASQVRVDDDVDEA